MNPFIVIRRTTYNYLSVTLHLSGGNGLSLFIGIMLILIGLLNVKFPAFLWFISTGWKFADAEPSDIALGINRFIGYFLLVAGVCYILDFFIPGLSG
jgi:hypothetical protein